MDQSKFFQELSEKKKPDVIPYDMREDVKRAIDDFRYLGTQSYCVVLYDMGLMSVTKNGVQLAKVLCVPIDLSKKSVSFPKNKINFEDPKMHIAAVCYNNNKVVDTLLLNASLFANTRIKAKSGISEFFSNIFKKGDLAIEDIDKGELVLKTKKVASLRKYAFGVMIGQLQGKN